MDVILRRQNVFVGVVELWGRGRFVLAGYAGLCLIFDDSLKSK